MMRCRHSLAAALPLALALLALPCTASGADTAPAWNTREFQGAEYLSLEELRSLYKFTTAKHDRKAGTHTVGNGTPVLVFGPGERELGVHGFHCELSRPLRQDDRGELHVSKMDMVKLIDPLLRPTYITRRQELKTIVLDPGHGGHDVGTQANQLREADHCLSFARQLAALLRERGYEVVLTREDNQYLSDHQRIERANKHPGAILVSLHLNNGRSDLHGIETYTLAPVGETHSPRPGNAHDEANAALAFALHASLITHSGARDGGLHRSHYSMLSSVRCPAVMLELGYATHAEEAAALTTEPYRSALATAIADGLDTYARALKPGAAIPAIEPPPPPPAKESGSKKNESGGKATKSTKSTKSTKNSSSRKSTGRSGKKSSKSSGKKKKNTRRR